MEFSIEKRVTITSLCACRYTSMPPFCDGAHYRPEVGKDEYQQQFEVEGCTGSCQRKGTVAVEEDDEYE